MPVLCSGVQDDRLACLGMAPDFVIALTLPPQLITGFPERPSSRAYSIEPDRLRSQRSEPCKSGSKRIVYSNFHGSDRPSDPILL